MPILLYSKTESLGEQPHRFVPKMMTAGYPLTSYCFSYSSLITSHSLLFVDHHLWNHLPFAFPQAMTNLHLCHENLAEYSL